MEWYIYILVVVIGFLAGFISTVAGSGSLLTLPLLIFLGLDPNMANGTNRVAILMQSMSATSGFRKNKIFELNEAVRYGIPAIIGAIIGAFIAVETRPEILNYIIAIILVAMLILLLFNPKRWLKPKENTNKKFGVLKFLLFIAIGVYAGFLQASVGFFWLAALVLGSGYDLVKANAVKNFIIMLYVPITVVIFAFNNQIDYGLGLLLGVGSVIGARVAVYVSVKKGSSLIRYFLLLAILGSAVKLIFF